ncbi:MAG: LysR family transcriptional regulator [Bacteroidales bacterium]|nr:LysR family transcriptional regulator [Bacteroidales bacterium]
MELRQLKYFVKIAELSSFSEAAKVLNVTQSTLSQQIKNLEDELDAALLVRDNRHVSLTDLGQAFLPQAKKTLADADTTIDKIRNVKGVVTGSINIGTTYTFSPILTDVLLLFIRKHPGVKVNIICHPVDELMTMLSQQEVDVVFSYRSTESYPDIESYSLFFNRLSAVMCDTHPLADRKTLTLGELSNCTLALPGTGMQARNVFDSMASKKTNNFNIQMEVNDIAMLLDIVASSHMVTLLSHATIKRGHGLVSIPVEGDECRMDGCYHVKSGVYMKCATREFIRMVDDTKSLYIRKMNL